MTNEKNELIGYLKQNRLMVLSTHSETGPWAATVFYAVDDNNDLYFISAKETKHASDIEKDNKVAIAIAGTEQQLYAEKIGVQMLGSAEKLEPQSEEYKQGLKLFLTRVWGYSEEKVLELETVKSMSGVLFRVKIDFAMFMNEKLFGQHVSKKIVLKNS